MKWENTIDHDDAPDGSEGGYDRRGNRIPPDAMEEIVSLRQQLQVLDKLLQLRMYGKSVQGWFANYWAAIHDRYHQQLQALQEGEK